MFNNTNGVNAYARDENTDVSIFEGAIGVGVYGTPGRVPRARVGSPRRASTCSVLPASRSPRRRRWPQGEPNQVVSSLAACQQLTLLVDILDAAGEELNYGSFTTAGHGLGEVELPGEPEPFDYGPPPHADGDRPLFRYEFDVTARQFTQAF